MSYLGMGGSLYIESVDIGINHTGTEFFDDLGLMYIGDGDEQEMVKIKGGPDCLATELTYFCLGGYDPHYSVDRLESYGSELLFSSEDGYGRMFIKEDEGYRAISSSVILAALASGDSLNLRAYLVSEMVNTFLGYNPSTSLKEVFSGLLDGYSYPNPFSGKTTIEYTLTEAGRVTIDVYDLSGKVVKQLVNNETLPGSYSVTWDATSDNGSLVNGGFYFFKVRQGNQSVTEKMVLLR
jgi:hypothetical protein